MNGGGGRNACRALLYLEDVRAILERAAELRGVDGEAKSGVDARIDDGVLLENETSACVVLRF